MPDRIKRSPRFERAGNPPAIELTRRDIEIIQAVYKHRFLNSDQIALPFGGSRQNLLRRLQLLFHHGYLDRPRAQLEYFQPTRNQPIAYGLGNKGADLLAERFELPRRSIDWQTKNHSIRRLFLQHALLVSDTTIKLEVACRASSSADFVSREAILEECPVETKRRWNPFAWQVRAIHEGVPLALGIDPDAVFGISPANHTTRSPAYVFLEADRATMPVMRRGFERSSIYRKMLAYHESWRQGLHERRFGFSRFCVLFMTTSAERIVTMIEANRHFNAGKGSAQFLFADRAMLSSSNTLTHPIRNGAGQTLTLLDLIR